MKLSIIIVNHNYPKLIETCIRSIQRSRVTFSYEIIVVDNASDYSIKDQISKFNPQIQLIQNKDNVGFGRANNQAVLKAKGEYVLFLNTDIEVRNGALEKIVRFAEKNEDAIVGGKLLNQDLSPQASCGLFYTLPVTFLMLFVRGDRLHLTRYSPDVVKNVDWVSGACIIIKKDHFNMIGGFDESIFMYMDEIDLCFRAKKRGLSTLFYPDAAFIHIGAASSVDPSAPILNIYRGLLYFYKKHANSLQYILVKAMLAIKAYIIVVVAMVTSNKPLLLTYRKALALL